MIKDNNQFDEYDGKAVKLDGDEFTFNIEVDLSGKWLTFHRKDLTIWATIGFEGDGIPLAMTSETVFIGLAPDYIHGDHLPYYPEDWDEYVKIVDHYWFDAKKSYLPLAEWARRGD